MTSETNLEEEFFRVFGMGKPVIKSWCYDGYYEDFSWQSSEEDCTGLLKHFDNSIDKLNDRIQQMKKEENTKYDRFTDSVDTEFGRVSKAYVKYPQITSDRLLEMICIVFNTFQSFEINRIYTIETLKNKILSLLILAKDDVCSEIQQLFK